MAPTTLFTSSNRNIDIDVSCIWRKYRTLTLVASQTALAFWEVILKPKLPQVFDFTEYIAVSVKWWSHSPLLTQLNRKWIRMKMLRCTKLLPGIFGKWSVESGSRLIQMLISIDFTKLYQFLQDIQIDFSNYNADGVSGYLEHVRPFRIYDL